MKFIRSIIPHIFNQLNTSKLSRKLINILVKYIIRLVHIAVFSVARGPGRSHGHHMTPHPTQSAQYQIMPGPEQFSPVGATQGRRVSAESPIRERHVDNYHALDWLEQLNPQVQYTNVFFHLFLRLLPTSGVICMAVNSARPSFFD